MTLGEGVHTLAYWAVDNAGNVEAQNSLEVRVDTTPPKISGAPTTGSNASGWYNTDVIVHFEASDDLSGPFTSLTARSSSFFHPLRTAKPDAPYITNFKTDKRPATYTVKIYWGQVTSGAEIGEFTFETTK